MKPGVYAATIEAVEAVDGKLTLTFRTTEGHLVRGYRRLPPPSCRAAHHNGYVCEHRDGLGHAGPHVGGDYTWYGTTPWRERQNKVLEALDGASTVAEIAEVAELPRRTVRRMLHSLHREGLARPTGRRTWTCG